MFLWIIMSAFEDGDDDCDCQHNFLSTDWVDMNNLIGLCLQVAMLLIDSETKTSIMTCSTLANMSFSGTISPRIGQLKYLTYLYVIYLVELRLQYVYSCPSVWRSLESVFITISIASQSLTYDTELKNWKFWRK